MSLPLFDCNASLGVRLGAPADEPATLAELLAELDRLEIGRALVRHLSGRWAGLETGNARLEAEAGGEPRLARAWTAVPDTGGDQPPTREWLAGLLKTGARAVCLYPKSMKWCLDEWCAGRFLAALEEHRVPAFLTYAEADLNAIHGALSAHPRLPLILSEISYRDNRMLYPLLAAHPNLHLDLSPRYSVHECLEHLCARGWARRALFGTGYPAYEGGAAVTQLMYARISEEERALLGAGNLERLLTEVRA